MDELVIWRSGRAAVWEVMHLEDRELGELSLEMCTIWLKINIKLKQTRMVSFFSFFFYSLWRKGLIAMTSGSQYILRREGLCIYYWYVCPTTWMFDEREGASSSRHCRLADGNGVMVISLRRNWDLENADVSSFLIDYRSRECKMFYTCRDGMLKGRSRKRRASTGKNTDSVTLPCSLAKVVKERSLPGFGEDPIT